MGSALIKIQRNVRYFLVILESLKDRITFKKEIITQNIQINPTFGAIDIDLKDHKNSRISEIRVKIE